VRREPEAVSIKKLVGYKNCISIDPSSNSLAWAVISYENKLIGTGKISFGKGSAMSAKLECINHELPEILSKYKTDRAVIEQSVYIQNFQSSRILSYIIGHTFGEIIRCNVQCEDVSPLSWKPGIGYKNLSKREVEELKKQGIDLSNQAKLKNERKDRVRRIIMMAYGEDIENIKDDDIVDAIGIGLWYHLKYAARAI
jgi:Holliday junction resolvasome RuvABC endonuclease subunit